MHLVGVPSSFSLVLCHYKTPKKYLTLQFRSLMALQKRRCTTRGSQRRCTLRRSAVDRRSSSSRLPKCDVDSPSLLSLSRREGSSSLERKPRRGILHFASTQPGLERALYKELKDINLRAGMRSEAPIVHNLRLANAGVEFELLRQRDV